LVEYTVGNSVALAMVLGDLAGAKQLLDAFDGEITTPDIRGGYITFRNLLALWLEERPTLASVPPDDSQTVSGQALTQVGEITQRVLVEQREDLAELISDTLHVVRRAMGIDDDFMHLWPLLVRAALWLPDVDLAGRLLEPVSQAQPGLVSEAVAAHHLNLSGLVAAARGDDPWMVELDLRGSVAAFETLGCLTWAAQATEDIARWLAEQGRAEEALAGTVEALRRYDEIGATGAAARLRSWAADRELVAPTS
jgi:hypothetical protein